MLMKVKKAKKRTLTLKLNNKLNKILAEQIKTALVSGKCRAGDGRAIATHSQSGLCDACLGNLAVKRRLEANEPARRTKFRAALMLATWREDELATNPTGYRRGAAR